MYVSVILVCSWLSLLLHFGLQQVLRFQLHGYRFAKKKLDGHVFFGNRLQVSYASQFESLSDTKEKLEGRRREVIARLYRKLHSE